MAAYFVLVTGKMIASIRIMNCAKRAICVGEKIYSYKKCIVKPEELDRLEDVKVEFVKDNIDFQLLHANSKDSSSHTMMVAVQEGQKSQTSSNHMKNESCLRISKEETILETRCRSGSNYMRV